MRWNGLLIGIALCAAGCNIALDPIGRTCTNAAQCADGDRCEFVADVGATICVPGNFVNGPRACDGPEDCADGEGCVQLEAGLFCQGRDGSGVHIQFGSFSAVPRLQGRTQGGFVVRHGNFAAKPWITGRTSAGFTVVGGDFR